MVPTVRAHVHALCELLSVVVPRSVAYLITGSDTELSLMSRPDATAGCVSKGESSVGSPMPDQGVCIFKLQLTLFTHCTLATKCNFLT